MTGVWIVEVRKMTGGVSKTIRRRTRDYTEAKRIEASLRAVETDIRPPPIFPIAFPVPSFKTRLPAVRTTAANSESSSSSYGGGSGVDILTVSPEPKIFTVRDLYDGARSIYRGNKDQKQSEERLHAALEIIGWDMDVQELRTTALDYLVQVLQARKLNPKTINRYLYAVSGALRWALSRELIPGMPTIPTQSEGVGRINYLTEEDQGRVIQWLKDNDFPDVAFATDILLRTGLRISEFLGLAQDNIKGDWIILHEGTTKNDERRTVYLGDLTVELSARVASGLPPYTRIVEGLSLASSALSIKPKVTPHVLRHSCATMLTTKGVSLATVGKMLGHKSLSTTLKYAHTEDQALIDAAKRIGVRGKSSG
jgi:site-specific recombinase XerD